MISFLPSVPEDHPVLSGPSVAMWHARRLRDAIFPDAGFADPAWDMLLELYNAFHERRPIRVSDLCVAAQVSSSTALRWMHRLEDRGYICRLPDSRDRRATIVEMSDAGRRKMTDFMERCGLAAHMPAATATPPEPCALAAPSD